MADLPRPRLARPALRWAYLLLAGLSLAAGVVGLFLPLVPTVPFILLAAWAAARSSPRLSSWLESHPRFGPPIRDWRRGGVVRRHAKWLASGLMAASGVGMLLVLGPRWFVWAAIAVMAGVCVWLWRRPESVPD